MQKNLLTKKRPRLADRRAGAARKNNIMQSNVIISGKKPTNKHLEPRLRLISSRSVEWPNLETEKERRVAVTYFWKGVEQAQSWQKEGLL